MNENKRNYGIDILRIIAMTYVVILHCLGHGGGIMFSSTVLRDYKISRFLEIFVYSAVDIFNYNYISFIIISLIFNSSTGMW